MNSAFPKIKILASHPPLFLNWLYLLFVGVMERECGYSFFESGVGEVFLSRQLDVF